MDDQLVVEGRIEWRKELYGWEELKECPFNDEEFVALNRSLQMIKYDPDSIRKNLPLEAKNLRDFFGGFRIYQFPEISKYRQFPLRVIYSKMFGHCFELMGTSTPFSELMDFMRNKKVLPDVLDEPWVYKYVLLYYDNIAGRHGRFDLIDFKSSLPPFNQLLDRINNFYKVQYSKHHHNVSIEDYYKQEIKSMYDDLEADDVLLAIRQCVENYFNGINFIVRGVIDVDEENNKAYVFNNFFIVFKTSLFIADVSVSLEENSFGEVDVFNQRIYGVRIGYNPSNSFLVDFGLFGEDEKFEIVSSVEKGDVHGVKMNVLDGFPFMH